MRRLLVVLPLMMAAVPAHAEAAPQVPPDITNPAMADKLADMAGALGRALMNAKVGELKAIAEGREASPAEKQQTVRDLAGGAAAEAQMERQLAQAKPVIEHGMKAMARALPAMIAALEGVADELDRASANLPQPGYPKR